MLLTDESLPLGTAAAATGTLASFTPSTLAPVLLVVEDMVVLRVLSVARDFCAEQWTASGGMFRW